MLINFPGMMESTNVCGIGHRRELVVSLFGGEERVYLKYLKVLFGIFESLLSVHLNSK